MRAQIKAKPPQQYPTTSIKLIYNYHIVNKHTIAKEMDKYN